MGKTKCCKFEHHSPALSSGHSPADSLSGGSCFPAGVLILMADGSYKPIEEIRPDDYVMSYDFENKKLSVSKVLAIESPLRDNVCVLRFNDITPHNNYFAGKVLVHNDVCGR